MAYMLLILENAEERRNRPQSEGQRAYARMNEFNASLSARGVLRACESLSTRAQRVGAASQAGKRGMVDGPFAEAKELVGGFFLLDCETEAEAQAIALECPAAEWATVELRQVAPCYEN